MPHAAPNACVRFLRRLFALPADVESSVTLDSAAGTLTLRRPEQRPRVVNLAEVCEIAVVVRRGGPLLTVPHWVLRTTHGDESFPLEGDATAELVAAFQALPGFADQALARALASATPGEYVCWSRDAAPAPESP